MIQSRQPHSGNDLDISTNTNKAGRTQWSFPLSRVPESFEDETESFGKVSRTLMQNSKEIIVFLPG